jgi:hypothetical protein
MSLTRYRRILSMRERLAVLPLVRLGNATSLIADVLRLVRDAPTSLLRAVAALGRRVRTALDGAVAVNVLGLRAVRDTRVAYDVAELGRVDRARGELEGAAQRSCSCRDAGLEDRRAVVWSDGIAALGLELVVRRAWSTTEPTALRSKLTDQIAGYRPLRRRSGSGVIFVAA